MGNIPSVAKQRLQDWFERKCREHNDRLDDDDYEPRMHLNIKDVLDLSDIIKEALRVDPTHLGVLYILDRNKDGKYDLQELLDFVDLACHHCRSYHERDHGVMVQGYCSLLMWRALGGSQGKQQFAQWMRRLFSCDVRLYQFESHPGVQYIRCRDVDPLYQMFDIQRCHGLDSAQLVELMQASAADEGLLDLDEPEQEDKLPLQVIDSFAEAIFEGMSTMMESFLDGVNLQDVLPSPRVPAAATVAATP